MILDNILDGVGDTPLVTINRLNPNPSVKLLAKVEFYNPGGSIKDRVGLAMVEAAEKAGLLTPGKTIIEATSGNTGVGLAMVCAVKGYKLKLLMPETASEERKKIMVSYGAEIMLTPGRLSTDGAIEEAYRLAREEPDKYVLMDQFNNPASIDAHYEGTGKEIWEQTGGEVTHVVLTLGTSGTAMGVTKRLKECNPDVQIVAVEPYAGHKIQGLKNMQESYPPGIYDKRVLDRIVHVEDEEAFEAARQLAHHEGVFVGMSSGAAMAAAGKLCSELDKGTVVVIFPDSGERYLSTTLFTPKTRQGVALRSVDKDAPVVPTPGAKGMGLFTPGPSLDALDDVEAWRRIVLLDVLARYFERRETPVHLSVGVADMDDRAVAAARAAGTPLAQFSAQALEQLNERAALLGLRRVTFHPASRSADTVLEICRRLLGKGAAYEKLRSVYFDVLRFKQYGQLSHMDLESLSLGKTVDLEDYVKENPKDFTLLKRASLQDLKSGDCFQTEWGNVRPSWFLQLAAAALDSLPDVSVFLAGEAQRFPHLENFYGILSLGGNVSPQVWMCSHGVFPAEKTETEKTAPEQLPSVDALGRGRGAYRLWLLSAFYHKPLTCSAESRDMWRKNWSKAQNVAVALAEQAAGVKPKAPGKAQAPELSTQVEQLVVDLRTGLRKELEHDLALHQFWPVLFKFCRDAHKLLDKGELSAEEAQACLDALQGVDAALGILEPELMPLPKADWPADIAGMVDERNAARSAKDFARADELRGALLARGYELEDTANGARLFLK